VVIFDDVHVPYERCVVLATQSVQRFYTNTRAVCT